MIFGFCVFVCIYEVEKMWFKIKKNDPEVWTIFVRDILGDIFGMFAPKWSSYVAEASNTSAHGIDCTWSCHHFCKDFHVFVAMILLISMVIHPIGETLKNTYICIACVCFYHFANTCFLIIFETCFAVVVFTEVWLYVGPMLASFWYNFRTKTKVRRPSPSGRACESFPPIVYLVFIYHLTDTQ